MEHPGFWTKAGPFSLSEIAADIGADVKDPDRNSMLLDDIRPLAQAGAGQLSFLDNIKYRDQLSSTTASAVIVAAKHVDEVPKSAAVLIADKPYHCFARALGKFYPEARHSQVCKDDVRNQSSNIHPTAQIEDGAQIEPGAIVGREASVGRGAVICAGAIIGYRVTIGRDTYIGPGASVVHSLIGDKVIIHAGVRCGQDGFGFALAPQGHLKVPQIGRVIIHDDVEIGANSTIDRGALEDTVIGEGSKIDNLVQIAHNVHLGRNCVIVAQVGISGSTKLGDFVVFGGQAGAVGHINIGDGVQVAGGSKVAKSVAPGMKLGGVPAQPIKDWMKEIALLKLLRNERAKRNAHPTQSK